MAPEPKDKRGKDKPDDKSKGRGGKDTKGPKQDKINQDQIEEDYGLSYALFKAFPELDDLLQKAVNNNWSPQKFQVELRQTKWFQKHSDTWREITALQHSDPATFQERLENTKTAILNMAGSVSAVLSNEGLDRLAKRALLFGMDEAQIRDVLAKHVKPSSTGTYTGELAGIEQDLRSTALANGVSLNDEQVQRWMRSIVRGEASQDQFVTNIRGIAASQFSLYGEQIRSGMDLVDVASPYMQSMADILEVNPASLTLTDPTIRRALSGARDQQGKVNPMTISDFEDSLRRDPRYMYTKQATRTAETLATQLAKSWGRI